MKLTLLFILIAIMFNKPLWNYIWGFGKYIVYIAIVIYLAYKYDPELFSPLFAIYNKISITSQPAIEENKDEIQTHPKNLSTQIVSSLNYLLNRTLGGNTDTKNRSII